MNSTKADRFLTFIFLAALPALLPTPTQGQGFTIAPLVLQGDPVPGGGDTFDRFPDIPPILNDNGQTCFQARYVSTFDDRLIRMGGGPGTLLVTQGDAAPDGNGTMQGWQNHTMNPAGRTAFAGDVSTFTGTHDSAGVFSTDGTLTQIARGDENPPGGNGVFSEFPHKPRIGSVAINSAGQVAFRACLDGTLGGGSDDQGIYRGDGSVATVIAREGVPVGAESISILDDPSMNDAGQVAFFAMLDGRTSGYYRGDGTSIVKLIATGDSAGGGDVSGHAHTLAPINNSGAIAVAVNLINTPGGSTDNAALFVANSGSKVLIAQVGDAVGGGTVGGFLGSQVPALNDNGQVAFNCGLKTGPTTFPLALCAGDGSSLQLIAMSGQAPPDGNGVFDSFGRPAINNHGQVLFEALITGSVGGAFSGIFLFDMISGTLQQVVRTGDSLAGSTITGFFHNPLPQLGNNGSALNNSGQVAIRFDLANGQTGLAIATPIAPVTVAITSITVVGGVPTINWTVTGAAAVDIYRSTDLMSWGAPIVLASMATSYTDPAPPGPPVFYAVVPAGTPFP